MPIELSNIGIDNTGINSVWTDPYPPFTTIPSIYPVMYHVVDKNKMEQAYNVVKMLVAKNLIKEVTVDKFIELVEEISKQL